DGGAGTIDERVTSTAMRPSSHPDHRRGRRRRQAAAVGRSSRPATDDRTTSATAGSRSRYMLDSRHTMATDRLGTGSEKRNKAMSADSGTGEWTASSGNRVMPTPAATIWRNVSKLVARNPRRSLAPV